MEFYETTEGRLGLRDIPPVLADLLRQIPHSGDRDSDEVEEAEQSGVKVKVKVTGGRGGGRCRCSTR